MIVRASIRIGIVLVAGLVAVATANAVPRQMGGVMQVINPSVTGSQAGERPPVTVLHDGVNTVEVGTPTGTAYTEVGNSLTIAEDVFKGGPGYQFRFFTGFVGVAQLTNTYSTPQLPAMFAAGGGAAAVSSQTLCPPRTGVVGGWTACTTFSAPNNPTNPASNNHLARIHIEKAGTLNGFGGVMSILRNVTSDVWFLIPPLPATPLDGKAAIASRQARPLDGEAWPGGQENGFNFAEYAFRGNRYDVTLTTSGKINAFTGALGTACTQPPKSGTTISGRCALPPLTPVDLPAARQWGWQMTTGLVSGSDDDPPNGTPMAPDFFFFVSQGQDTTEMTTQGATLRNLVLIGGGIAHSPAANQTFHRNTTLRMTIPEPGSALGVAAGVAVLVALGVARRRR